MSTNRKMEKDTCVYVCVCVCTYTYIYIYIHTMHTHIYTYSGILLSHKKNNATGSNMDGPRVYQTK